MSEVHLKIDLHSGLIEIDTSVEAFATVSEQAFKLLQLARSNQMHVEQNAGGSDDSAEVPDVDTPSDQQNKSDQDPRRTRIRRSKGTGKTANLEMVENLLAPQQQKDLREFYKSKSPGNQNEQVAVLAIKLKEMTGRESFEMNEIYTAFRYVDQKTPGNLGAVFGNMTGLNLGSQADKKFKPNWKAEELVTIELPRKKSDK